MPSEGRDQFYANVTAIPEYAALRCNLLLFSPNIGKKGIEGTVHYSFSRSKYFHLLIAPIEGFITLIR